MYSKYRISPDASNLCRYGDPFRRGFSPVVMYFAGVGTEPNIDDVVPFREVISPKSIRLGSRIVGTKIESGVNHVFTFVVNRNKHAYSCSLNLVF